MAKEFRNNDPTRYAQLLRERRKSAMTYTQSLVWEGFVEKYSGGENCGQASSQQLNIRVFGVLGVVILSL